MMQSWPRVQLLIAAVLFSTGGVAIKGNDLTSWQVASFRCGIAVIALLVLIPESRRNWSPRLIPVAVIYALNLVLFVVSSKLTTAANAIFLQSTAPGYLVLLSPLVLHEKLRRSDMLLLAGVAAGLLLLFFAPHEVTMSAPDPVRGNILAALGGLTWALTMMGLRWVGRGEKSENTPATAVVMGSLIAFAATLPLAMPVSTISASDITVMVYLGVFQVGLAYVCLTRAIQRVPAFEASTLLLLEPALNPVWTWLLLKENPGPWAITGGAVILSATLANTWWAQRRRSPVPATTA
jgi:drug/metabolite transporter (DMT)-like permease